MTDKWDWKQMFPSWLFHQLALEGFPSWQKLSDGQPANVLLTIKNKVDRSSREIAIEFDDICKGGFYYRDFTDNGLPFVNDGEAYRSRFSFQFIDDARLFHSKYGGELMPTP